MQKIIPSKKMAYSFINQVKPIGIKVWHFIESQSTIIFCLLLFLLDLSYPIIISYDSGHYLWLTSLIKERQWSLWDPARNIGFPLLIHFSRVMFGDNANAVHYLFAFLHCILLIVGVNIVNFAVNDKRKPVISKFIIFMIVFVLIALDSTIFGYYNTLLTEFVSVTLAVLAIWLCILILREDARSSNFQTILYTCCLVILVVLSWHVKQPYVGAALFPFIFLAAVLFVNKASRKKSTIIIIGVVTSLIAVFMTTQLWNGFLVQNGNPMPPERQVTNMIKNTSRNQLRCIGVSGSEKESIINQYLAFSNFYYLDQSRCDIITEPKLFISAENGAISQRIFNNKGISNILGVGPYTSYVQMFDQADNYPSDRINDIFAKRVPISNFLFTSSMLVLPLFFVVTLLVYLLRKNELAAILTIVLGTSFGNLLGHLVMGILPIDRYLLLSYVLNLLSLVIGIIVAGNWIRSFAKKCCQKGLAKKSNSPGTRTEKNTLS
jgi:hypothetical protein